MECATRRSCTTKGEKEETVDVSQGRSSNVCKGACRLFSPSLPPSPPLVLKAGALQAARGRDVPRAREKVLRTCSSSKDCRSGEVELVGIELARRGLGAAEKDCCRERVVVEERVVSRESWRKASLVQPMSQEIDRRGRDVTSCAGQQEEGQGEPDHAPEIEAPAEVTESRRDGYGTTNKCTSRRRTDDVQSLRQAATRTCSARRQRVSAKSSWRSWAGRCAARASDKVDDVGGRCARDGAVSEHYSRQMARTGCGRTVCEGERQAMGTGQVLSGARGGVEPREVSLRGPTAPESGGRRHRRRGTDCMARRGR